MTTEQNGGRDVAEYYEFAYASYEEGGDEGGFYSPLSCAPNCTSPLRYLKGTWKQAEARIKDMYDLDRDDMYDGVLVYKMSDGKWVRVGHF